MKVNSLGFLIIYKVEINHYADYHKGVQVYIQKDVKDLHVYRLLPNTNRHYNHSDLDCLVEVEHLSLYNVERGQTVIDFLEENDNYENWESEEYDEIDEAIEAICGDWDLSSIIIKEVE